MQESHELSQETWLKLVNYNRCFLSFVPLGSAGSQGNSKEQQLLSCAVLVARILFFFVTSVGVMQSLSTDTYSLGLELSSVVTGSPPYNSE